MFRPYVLGRKTFRPYVLRAKNISPLPNYQTIQLSNYPTI